ncbi:uncharacterized protein ACIBXB_003379 [Morphnus guianensis]
MDRGMDRGMVGGWVDGWMEPARPGHAPWHSSHCGGRVPSTPALDQFGPSRLDGQTKAAGAGCPTPAPSHAGHTPHLHPLAGTTAAMRCAGLRCLLASPETPLHPRMLPATGTPRFQHQPRCPPQPKTSTAAQPQRQGWTTSPRATAGTSAASPSAEERGVSPAGPQPMHPPTEPWPHRAPPGGDVSPRHSETRGCPHSAASRQRDGIERRCKPNWELVFNQRHNASHHCPPEHPPTAPPRRGGEGRGGEGRAELPETSPEMTPRPGGFHKRRVMGLRHTHRLPGLGRLGWPSNKRPPQPDTHPGASPATQQS